MHQNNGFCFFHHLAFRNPQGSLCNCDGKVIDFNTIELTDGNLYRVPLYIAKDNLPLLQFPQHFIFQSPQADVGFRQKVSRTAGGVQK